MIESVSIVMYGAYCLRVVKRMFTVKGNDHKICTRAFTRVKINNTLMSADKPVFNKYILVN